MLKDCQKLTAIACCYCATNQSSQSFLILTRTAHSQQGQVEQIMANLACVPASRLSCLGRGHEWQSREKALAHMPIQKDTRHLRASLDTRDRY